MPYYRVQVYEADNDAGYQSWLHVYGDDEKDAQRSALRIAKSAWTDAGRLAVGEVVVEVPS